MSKRQKEIEQAIKDMRAGTRTFSKAEIADLKRSVARQRGRRRLLVQAKEAFPTVTDYGQARRGTVPLGRRAPGSFESKK
ncbi:hypothetical protein OH687_39530 (plasmid) [Burkholderia anthina]|nr:hypothetical protein OH687_39530 [Burkholderia anthina]